MVFLCCIGLNHSVVVNEEGLTHEGSMGHPSTANYDHMCNLFGESLLMALEAQASHDIANSTTTRKLRKRSSEILLGPPVNCFHSCRKGSKLKRTLFDSDWRIYQNCIRSTHHQTIWQSVLSGVQSSSY